MGQFIFGLFFILLLAASGIIILYYLQLSGPLNRAVDRYLGRGSQTAIPPLHRHPYPAPPPAAQPSSSPVVLYDYYLQIAAWPAYDQAEKSRDGFIRNKIPAIIRRGFNARRRTTFYRVWLGPYPTSAEAAGLKKRGTPLIPGDAFVDSILRSGAPSPLPPAAIASDTREKTKATAGVPAGWYIVVASLRSRSEAEKEADRLKKKGIGALVQDWQGGSAVWYRVQAGPFHTEGAAREELRARRAIYGEEAFVTSRSR